MNSELKVYCKNTQEYIPIDGGDTLLDLYHTIKPRLKVEALCALVNNKCEDLRYPVYGPKHVEFIGLENPHGFRAYVRSLCMVLYKAIRDLYPGKRLRIEHSISGGFYCILKHDEKELSVETVEAIKARMHEIVEQDLTFVRRERLTTDVIEMFRQQGLNDKVRLLTTCHDLYTVYYKLGDLIDSYYGPLVPSTGLLKVFDLQPYEEGMLLLPPMASDPSQPTARVEMPKMFEVCSDAGGCGRGVAQQDVRQNSTRDCRPLPSGRSTGGADCRPFVEWQDNVEQTIGHPVGDELYTPEGD